MSLCLVHLEINPVDQSMKPVGRPKISLFRERFFSWPTSTAHSTTSDSFNSAAINMARMLSKQDTESPISGPPGGVGTTAESVIPGEVADDGFELYGDLPGGDLIFGESSGMQPVVSGEVGVMQPVVSGEVAVIQPVVSGEVGGMQPVISGEVSGMQPVVSSQMRENEPVVSGEISAITGIQSLAESREARVMQPVASTEASIVQPVVSGEVAESSESMMIDDVAPPPAFTPEDIEMDSDATEDADEIPSTPMESEQDQTRVRRRIIRPELPVPPKSPSAEEE
eukprot:98221_1